MTATPVPDGITLTTTVVQVIKGGEPDDLGVSLAGLLSPTRMSLSRRCACAPAALFCEAWESLDRYDLYSPATDLWLRTLAPDQRDEPRPEGAVLLDTRTVVTGCA